MAGIYKVTEKELRFLLMFAEKRRMYGFDELLPIELEEEAQECVQSLCGRGIVRAGGNGKYAIDVTLELLLTVAEQPYGCFFMEDLREEESIRKSAVYFRDDVIAFVGQRDENWELMWLPYLPLAVGEIANLHEPFLNTRTERAVQGENTENVSTEWIDECLRNGFFWQWEMWGEQLEDDRKQFSINVLSDGKTQLLILETEDGIRIFKPDKADYINEITRQLAFLHGKAIQKILQEEG